MNITSLMSQSPVVGAFSRFAVKAAATGTAPESRNPL